MTDSAPVRPFRVRLIEAAPGLDRPFRCSRLGCELTVGACLARQRQSTGHCDASCPVAPAIDIRAPKLNRRVRSLREWFARLRYLDDGSTPHDERGLFSQRGKPGNPIGRAPVLVPGVHLGDRYVVVDEIERGEDDRRRLVLRCNLCGETGTAGPSTRQRIRLGRFPRFCICDDAMAAATGRWRGVKRRRREARDAAAA